MIKKAFDNPQMPVSPLKKHGQNANRGIAKGSSFASENWFLFCFNHALTSININFKPHNIPHHCNPN